jgi:sugar lactone lactonase YvrE
MSVILSARHERVERIELADAGLPGLHAWRVNNRVGESPTWDVAAQRLLWIDVRAPAVLRLDPRTSVVTRWDLPEVVGALGLTRAGCAVLALTRRLAHLDLRSGNLEPWVDVGDEPTGNRLNDGKVSPSGRWFVFGSMDDRAAGKQPTGALYRAGADGSIARLSQGLTIANGIAWSPDAATLYFSDSFAGRVWHAAWNEAEGSMADPVPFCEADESFGRPDGAAVDALGQYWSAGVSAGCLNRFAADGRHLARWALPCRAPTMPCFGGSDLGTLFVTSLVRPALPVHTEGLDGALFALTAGVQGIAAPRLALSPGDH